MKLNTYPILVYGPKKGGTTLVLNLLDGRDDFVVFPSELKLKYFVDRPDIDELTAAEYYRRSAILKQEFPSFSQKRYTCLVEETLRCGHPGGLRRLILHDVGLIRKSMANPPRNAGGFVAKEVGGDTHSIVQLWRKLFPHGKVVMVLRDPKMVSRSLFTFFRRAGRSLSTREVWLHAKQPVETLRDQLEYRGAEDIIFVMYERLTTQPELELRRLCSKLDIEWHDQMLIPSVSGAPVITSTASNSCYSIFQNKYHWWHGLNLRERLAVICLHRKSRSWWCFPRRDE